MNTDALHWAKCHDWGKHAVLTNGGSIMNLRDETGEYNYTAHTWEELCDVAGYDPIEDRDIELGDPRND